MGGSYTWEAPLKNYDQMDKLRFPVITVDQASTDRLIGLARSVLGDLLEVRLRTRWWWTLGMTWTLVNLRGLEQIMFDLVDYPEELQRLMAFLRDGHLAKLDFLESARPPGRNHDGTYVGSGGFGYTRQLPQAILTRSAYGQGTCGAFVKARRRSVFHRRCSRSLSIPYQYPILKRFGLTCYGCCEPLDKRWPIIKDAPALRRVSVSPWADLKTMAGQLEDKFIFSYKPSPADLAMPRWTKTWSGPRSGALDVTRGCRLEIIMKDNHTMGNNPANATRWCRIAREEIERVYGSAGEPA